MDNVIIVGIITVITQFVLELGKWVLTRRKEKSTIKNLDSETDKNVAEKRKLDLEVLESLNETVENLTTSYLEVNNKYMNVQNEFSQFKNETNKTLQDLRTELDLVKTENSQLKEKNKVVENDIDKLKKENVELKLENLDFRKMIEQEKFLRKKWEIGIGRLVKQIEDVPMKPVWLPTDE